MADQMAFDLVVPRTPAAAAPQLATIAEPHSRWPFLGMTPEDCGRSALANSEAFADVIAWSLRAAGGGPLAESQLKAALPLDWLNLLGQWAHGHLTQRQADARKIRATYVGHDGGGFHFSYVAEGEAA